MHKSYPIKDPITNSDSYKTSSVTWFHFPRACAPEMTMLLTVILVPSIGSLPSIPSRGHNSTLTSHSTAPQHCWRKSHPWREGCFYTKMTSRLRVDRPLMLSASHSSPSLVYSFQMSQDITICCPPHFLALQTMSSSSSASTQEPHFEVIVFRC